LQVRTDAVLAALVDGVAGLALGEGLLALRGVGGLSGTGGEHERRDQAERGGNG
jgi:hypothetical protein